MQEGESLIAQACMREAVEDNPPRGDRIEWQAGYISGALLMPKRRVDLLVGFPPDSSTTARCILIRRSGSPILWRRIFKEAGFRVNGEGSVSARSGSVAQV